MPEQTDRRPSQPFGLETQLDFSEIGQEVACTRSSAVVGRSSQTQTTRAPHTRTHTQTLTNGKLASTKSNNKYFNKLD